MNSQHSAVLARLNDLDTIRLRAHYLLAQAKENKLTYFSYHPEQMTATAAFVTTIIDKNYPTMAIPYHSRWRHFEVDGQDRVAQLMAQNPPKDPLARGKMLYELVILSVFLDAGAGAGWRYFEEATGRYYSRSEGLAIASLAMYQNGLFSAEVNTPLCVDAAQLIAFQESSLAQGFQINTDNPLAGKEGRIALLNQLGAVIRNKPTYFGNEGRLGDFYTYVVSLADNNTLSAKTLFSAVLAAFNDIWPKRLTYEGVSLGDVWQHSALKNNEPASEFMPFHKLSQWLTYSLLEPLEQTGIKVTDINLLTGLPEYRNGGLFIDMGVLSLRKASWLTELHEPGSELIVEWRALTVALLDELAQLIRTQKNQSEQSLPLAKILQGGTWEAGRQIARQKRTDGSPPLHIVSDGTVF